MFFFFFSSRRRHTRFKCDWSSDVCSSDLDAVTIALQYAGIPFEKVWDFEVLADKLPSYDWLHLHHEDFTGQYSKFYLIYAGAPWLREMVRFNTDAAKRLGFTTVPDLQKAVARTIREFVAHRA